MNAINYILFCIFILLNCFQLGSEEGLGYEYRMVEKNIFHIFVRGKYDTEKSIQQEYLINMYKKEIVDNIRNLENQLKMKNTKGFFNSLHIVYVQDQLLRYCKIGKKCFKDTIDYFNDYFNYVTMVIQTKNEKEKLKYDINPIISLFKNDYNKKDIEFYIENIDHPNKKGYAFFSLLIGDSSYNRSKFFIWDDSSQNINPNSILTYKMNFIIDTNTRKVFIIGLDSFDLTSIYNESRYGRYEQGISEEMEKYWKELLD